MSQLLTKKISAVRRKHASVCAGRGLAAMAGVLVLLLAAGMILDWLFELPRTVRTVLLVVDVVVLSYLLFRYVLAPVFLGPDDDDLALLVERHMPDFRTRLIASVQLARPGAVPAGVSSGLVRAMIAQTEQLSGPRNFATVINTEPLFKTVALSAFIVLLGAAAFAYTSHVSGDLLKRAMLANIPVPRNTRVQVLSGNVTLPIGEDVTLAAAASGVIPSAGRVELRYESGRRQTFSIDKVAEASDTFTRTVQNVQEPFDYRVRLNDGTSSWFRVEALPRPVVTAVEFHQKYPAYIKRPLQRRSPGDLSLLVGSELQVRVTSSKPLSAGQIQLVGIEQSAPMTVDGSNRNACAGAFTIPARGLTGLKLLLTDHRGIGSKAETVYPIDLLLDREPEVRITYPDRKEELATQRARVRVGFEAVDDFGIARVLLRWKYDTQEDAQAKSIELDLADQSDTRLVRRQYEFDLGAIRPLPPEGSTIVYWIEVHDGNNVTGPGKDSSDPYAVRVVTELEKRTDLLNRLNDQLGRIDFVTQDQEKLNQALGDLIHEKKP